MLAHSIEGHGPAIVFAHGIAADKTTWQPLVDRLRVDHHCVTVDLPGHGDSPAEGCDSLSAASGIYDLVAHLDLDQPTIVGHSLGATVALLYGALFAPRSVVAIDPVGLYLPDLAESLAPHIERMRSGDFAAGFDAWEQDLLEPVPAPQRASLAAGTRPSPTVVLSYWASLLSVEEAEATQPQFTEAVAAITAPTLVLLADPPSLQDAAVLAAMQSPTVEVSDGASHYLHLLDPDRFADRIRRWIAAVSGKRG